VSEENVERIKRQNCRKISVIIGNPPYNANQLNENENNKNREYPDIDKRIKETYIKESTAQKTKLYDMYARFFRWASDRVDENGIVAFISNRSFIESRSFDGFRKIVGREFNEIYVVDLGGDVRANPKLSGTKHNVFGIQTGVAISFLVKRKKTQGCRIFYARRPELETAEEKLAFLGDAKLPKITFEEISPDANHNWINLTQNDFESLIPIASKEAKAAASPAGERSLVRLFTLGVNSGRDDWMFDFDKMALASKLHFLLEKYHEQLALLRGVKDVKEIDRRVGTDIKWTAELKVLLRKQRKIPFEPAHIVESVYRPFAKKWYYFNRPLTKRFFRVHECQPTGHEDNIYVMFPANGATKRIEFCVFAVNRIPDLNFFTPDPAHAIVLYRYDESGQCIDNITDWVLDQFRKHYSGSVAGGVARRGGLCRADRRERGGGPQRQDPGSNPHAGTAPITKEDIFHYVYGVLHDPVYREKYALNLKREFPRIPFYADFRQWAVWGKELMALHIGYETVEPCNLKRTDIADDGRTPKAMLKADKENGRILLDSRTTLSDIPHEAWTYKLGNRSALEWILDQYKEKKPKDPTIREKFNTYRFADYKEKVIDLLQRVTTVSVRTQATTEAMRTVSR